MPSFIQSMLLGAIAVVGITNAKVSVDSANRKIRDAEGRDLLLHGVNVVYKVDPYIPTTTGDFSPQDSLNAEDIQNMVDWGFNLVRLGVMWEAVERTEGVFDMEYLAEVNELINTLGAAGIYTMVDMHQDVFARTICGEGFPNFYAKDVIGKHPACINYLVDHKLKSVFEALGICVNMDWYGFEEDDNGDPLISECQTHNFVDYYPTAQSQVAFDALYSNKKGLQDKFVAYWDTVSAYYSDNEYVIGFDPLNEPFPGKIVRHPSLDIKGNFDKTELAPMYERLHDVYQSHNTQNIMYFEPGQFPDKLGYFGGFVQNVGFQTPPGGEIGSVNHVLNDHTYCCAMSTPECVDGEPQIADADKCLAWHEKTFSKRDADAKRLGVPFILSEFGACLTEGPCSQEINQVTDVADEYLTGWAYWQFKEYEDLTTTASTGSEGFYNKDGSLQDYKVKALARTYMAATQGTLTAMNFNTTDGSFIANYTLDTSLPGTLLYASSTYFYPNGFDFLVLSNGEEIAHDVDIEYPANWVNFQLTNEELNGQTITIQITAI